MIEYIRRRQKEWQKKWNHEADLEDEREAIREAERQLEAEREAEREAVRAAEARRREEIAEHKKLLQEQQQAERLRQKRAQEKQKLIEESWGKQVDTLLAQIEVERRQEDKLQEIQIIIQNREPYLGVLNWRTWLSDPLNQRLAELDFEYAVQMFRRDNRMARLRPHKTRGKNPQANNYLLSFTGDTNTQTRRGDLVATDFNPDDFNLPSEGFTISYWVRPDELGSDMFAIGRKAHNNERFTFGISRKNKGYFGVGANQSERSWATMLDTAGIDKATHLVQDTDDEWILVVGRWYHFAVTYAGTNAGTNNMLRKIYMNGQQIWGTGVSDPTYKGNIAWSQTGTEMNKGLSFGMRAVRGSGTSTSYNNGWACGLDEVAIYNEEKDADFIEAVYNGGTKYNHTGASKLVGYWKFNEGKGTHVEDLSGNGNHGLLTNDSHGDDGGAAFASGVPSWELLPTSGY